MRKTVNYKLYTGIAAIALSLLLIGYISKDIKPVSGTDYLGMPAENGASSSAPGSRDDMLPQNYYIDKGIVSDSLLIYEGSIKRNQNLSEILLKYHVPYSDIDQLAKRSKEVFDVRKIVTGKSYSVFYSNDSLQKAQYFIYEPNAINYVVYNLKDSIYIYKGEKEVTTKIQTVSGVINSSLWQTMIDNKINLNLSLELSEIYAWAVDFYRIQKGDAFKVIYEEKFVEGEAVGIGRIKGAYFKHFREIFYAIYFEQGGVGDYFDQNEKSLRKAFLKSPLKYSRITSRYTMRRFHPVQKRYKPHLGVDYAAPRGTPIRSTGDGVVSKAGYKGGNGNYVKVKHNSVYSTQYLHMTNIKKGIKRGVRIKQGDIIGYVGSTGLATGPHVCYRFWKNGQQVNPLKVKIPPSEPVKPEYLDEYIRVKEEMMRELDDVVIL